MRFLATLTLLLLAAPVTAQPYLYWTTGTDGSIARSNLDGSEVDVTFIDGQNQPEDVVTDGTYLYWTNQTGNSIGRANLDGSGVDPEFITGITTPRYLTLDDTYLYWSNPGASAIGRGNLDGSGVDQEFISGVSAIGLDVSDSHIYWSTGFNGTIGRANIDGSGADESFVAEAPSSNAVHVAGDFLFWTRQFGVDTGVGRVGLDGSNPTSNLIPEATIGQGLASDGSTLYIARGFGNDVAIATANFDGSGYTVLLSNPGGRNAEGITVGSGAATSNAPTATPDAALRLAVAPNPARADARLTVEAAPGSTVRVAVYDALGREVAVPFAGALGATRTFDLDTAGLPAGVYFVRVESGDHARVQKLTVVR